MLAAMGADGRENVLALPRRALAGSVAGKALEALTLAGLVLLVPRALGPADYGGFAVALAVATGIATATGIGGPALFARVLGPLAERERRVLARALTRRLGAVRATLVAVVAAAALVAALLAPGTVSALQVLLVLAAVATGTAATLLSQLALGLERTTAWSLRYPLENAVIVVAALALYPLAGLDGAIAAIALGAAAALALGFATVRTELLPRAEIAKGGAAARGGSTTTLDAAARTARLEAAARGGGTARLDAATRVPLPAGVLRFARLQAAGGALTQIVHRGAAPACALLGAGAVAAGHAAIAAGAALAITYAVTQTTLVALPSAARAFAVDRAGAEASLRRVAGMAAVVVVPACALLALLAEPLLAAALGEDFRDAATPLRIALAAAALAPLWALATQLAALREQPEAALAGAAVGATAFVVVAAVAVPGGGADAAATAMLVGVATTIVGTFAALRWPRSRERATA